MRLHVERTIARRSAELSRVYAFVYRRSDRISTTDYLAFMDARAAASTIYYPGNIARFFRIACPGYRCGAGSLLKIFEERGARVTGFEPDVIMAATARSRLSRDASLRTSTFSREIGKEKRWILFACHMCRTLAGTLHLS